MCGLVSAKKAALEAKKAERAAAKDKGKGKKGKGKGEEEEEAPKQPSLTARCYCCQKQFARSTLEANEGLCRPACLTEWDERNAALPVDQRQNRPIRHSTYQQGIIGAQANKVSATSILNRLDEHKQDLSSAFSGSWDRCLSGNIPERAAQIITLPFLDRSMHSKTTLDSDHE